MRLHKPKPLPQPHNPQVPKPGGFSLDGRWLPEGDPYSFPSRLVKDMVRVRREGGSPVDFLLRLSKWQYSTEAVKLLGAETIGQMSHLEHADDWSAINPATAAGEHLKRCGRSNNGKWLDNGQWEAK